MTAKEKKDLIILFEAKKSADFPKDFSRYYHTHIFCLRGRVEFTFNDRPYRCAAGEFIFLFAHSKLGRFMFSKNFKAKVLLVETNFLNDNLPDLSLSIDAYLHSKEYPVLHLQEKKDKEKVLLNFDLLYKRYLEKEHRFYSETLRMQMQIFILEMWHTFANELTNRKRTIQSGTIYERFMQLMQEYVMKEREVLFYARKLNITSKYLNYICKLNTDITASAWIQRYARERILLLLQNNNLNITEIANKMNFSSTSFFTRYVKKLLGVTPREFRKRLK
jgi:AraC family transcriptional activator of pobA